MTTSAFNLLGKQKDKGRDSNLLNSPEKMPQYWFAFRN